MKALILAAGVGSRLGRAGGDGPKALLAFADRSLIRRHVELLVQAGLDEIVVATGYRSEAIAAELAALDDASAVRTVVNPDYRRGSVVTLWTLRGEVGGAEPILLLDADVLYDGRMLARLIGSAHANCFLLDREFEPGEEPMKLAVREGRLLQFRRRLTVDFELCGESVGFFKLAPEMAGRLIEACHQLIEAGRDDEGYETALGDLLDGAPEAFGFEDVTGLPWTEIDFPEDIRRAEREILPRLQPPGTSDRA